MRHLFVTVALLMAPFGALASEGAKGWYLMEPPVDETSDLGFAVLDQAPLTQWARIATSVLRPLVSRDETKPSALPWMK
jgi:hypothetical protein